MRSIILGILMLMTALTSSALDKIPDDELDRIFDESEELHLSSKHTGGRYYRKRLHPFIKEQKIINSPFSHAAAVVSDTFNIPFEEAERRLQDRATARRKGVIISNNCVVLPTVSTCVASAPYRTQDGSCNNLARPTWGMAVSPIDRMITPQYGSGNGNGTIKTRVDGAPLPPPRKVSQIVNNDVNNPSSQYTLYIVAFGQLLEHDMTSTPEFPNTFCCTNRNNPQCMAIDIPANDTFYSQFRINCLGQGRSIPACGLSNREQVNQATSFIDGSNVYGSSSEELTELRNGTGKFLKTDDDPRFLVKDYEAVNCGDPNRGIVCYLAGDERVNENPFLTSQHTLWMREHNRVAQLLANARPSLSDEIIFQEAKRIVAAEMQNIAYSEFLPVLLGSAAMQDYGLNLPSPGIFTGYDSTMSPNIFNCFSAAAYRLHSFLQNDIVLAGAGSAQLQFNFQNPQLIQQSVGNCDRILLGNVQQPVQSFDNSVVEAVTNHVLQKPNEPFGSDLVSLNIQRSRDHGLPGYNAFRVSCNLPPITNYTQLEAFFGSKVASKLADAYDLRTNVLARYNEIDLWPAGTSEPRVSGAALGPTFLCIVARQFKRALYGDRYFFTHGGQAGSFRSSQLSILRARTLGSVICDNTDPTIVTGMPQNSFIQGHENIPCANQPKLGNLFNWI